MRQEIEITVPTGWNDVTLRKYLELQKDLEAYKDEKDAQNDVLLYHLCGIEPTLLHSLSTESYGELIRAVEDLFQSQSEYDIQPIIKVGDTEYGFEPNLSKMPYGLYVDISKFESLTIDSNWAKIMSMLYRPITKRTGDSYLTEPYTGFVNEDLWLNRGMDIHFGALFFFVRLLKDLVNSTQKSLMQNPEIPPNIKSILEKSGKLIRQSLNSQEEIYKR